jgi:hypothetical protein
MGPANAFWSSELVVPSTVGTSEAYSTMLAKRTSSD